MVVTRRLRGLVASLTGRVDLPEGPLVVSLSGGADSASLGYLCTHLERDVRALHVNHGLPASRSMQQAASSIARQLGIDLDLRGTIVPEGASPEGQARAARYAVFETATHEGESLLTAHTRDDNVETVLFNLIRGTGPRGLGGIPYHRAPSIYRPILAITRDETRELASLARLSYVDDPMNDDERLARSFVRGRVVPMLSSLNPRLRESVARMAAAVSADNAYIEEKVAQVRVHLGEGTAAVAVGDLVSQPDAITDRVLKTMLTSTLGGAPVTSDRVKGLREVADGVVDSFEVGTGLFAVLVGPMLVVAPRGAPVGEGVVDLVSGVHRQGRLIFEVTAGGGVCRVFPLTRWGAVFPADSRLEATSDGVVLADGEPAWVPGEKRLPVAWYQPGSVGYLSVFAREDAGWTSSH